MNRRDRKRINKEPRAKRRVTDDRLEPLPGIYIHIPFCRKKCDYCDFYSVIPASDLQQRYTEALLTHLRETSQFVHSPVETVYIGGGTPAMLGEKNLVTLLKEVQRLYAITSSPEITVELNPESTSFKLLSSLKKAGCTRLSIGVQSAVDDELKKLGRLHTFDEAKSAVELCRKAGFDNISVDLMYGIEGQTPESFRYSLQEVINLDPEHVSCYGLKVEQGTPLWDRRETADLPDDDAQADFYETACTMLRQAGYQHYEISNFAKPGYASQHNLKYWRLEPYLGFGPGAHSDFAGRRYSIVSSLDAYIEGIENDGEVIEEMEEILPQQRAAEYVMLRLRLAEGFDPSEFLRQFMIWPDSIGDKLREYEKSGHAKVDGRWSLTEKGFLISNTIISSLLEYI
jgi:putative oxygen-independent coproporphyrinogen III oxidase